MLPIRILCLYSTCQLHADMIIGYVDTPFIQFRTTHSQHSKLVRSELYGIENTGGCIYIPALLRHHKMKAVGLYKHLPIEDPQSLVDLDIQQPMSVEVAVHEPEIPELPPALRQSCFWFVSVCTLTPVLFVFFVIHIQMLTGTRLIFLTYR
jgi:hypothetical protein